MTTIEAERGQMAVKFLDVTPTTGSSGGPGSDSFRAYVLIWGLRLNDHWAGCPSCNGFTLPDPSATDCNRAVIDASGTLEETHSLTATRRGEAGFVHNMGRTPVFTHEPKFAPGCEVPVFTN